MQISEDLYRAAGRLKQLLEASKQSGGGVHIISCNRRGVASGEILARGKGEHDFRRLKGISRYSVSEARGK